MKCLVTGGCGFLGSFIVDLLYKLGHVVHVLDPSKAHRSTGAMYWRYRVEDIIYRRNLADGDRSAVDQIYDCIFHCAGVLGTAKTFDKISDTNQVNIGGTVQVLEYAKQCGAAVIQPNLIDEWLNPYMISCHAREQYGLMFHHEYGVDYLSVRITHAYGPRQSTAQGKAVPDFITAALRNEPLTVYGDGSTLMNLIYITDVASFMVAAAAQIIDKYNCGRIATLLHPTDEISVLNLAQMVKHLCKSKSEIVLKPMRRGQPQKVPYSYYEFTEEHRKKLAAYITDYDFVTLDEGLERTIEWYRERLSKE